MLFEFGFFWKFIILMLLVWFSYGVWGFEFTTVTILAALFAIQAKKSKYF
tara:strand:+ start:1465 stop:1614 length:150 start_codon:yes stop_codon:yes gene_type:complete